MNTIANRPLVLLLTAVMMAATSTGYAAPGKSAGAGGWEPSADHVESVVISVKTDPLVDPEPACVALQIGMNLLMDSIEVKDNAGAVIDIPVTPADEVILFPTIGGVELVDPTNPELFDDVCLTPGGQKSLDFLLGAFVSMGGEVISCPLCLIKRGIAFDSVSPGVVADGVMIHDLFLYADKLIDF